MAVLLVSTYDLGRQPFGLASPAAWLRRAGFDPILRDVSRHQLTDDDLAIAGAAAFYLPMHTATRLALPLIDRVRARRPDLPMAAYGLYAPLNAPLLRAHGIATVLGPEAEDDLVKWALGARPPLVRGSAGIARLPFLRPDRAGLPPLDRYAALQMPDGSRRIVGATEATRGCKHRCRHCPIVPVYDGQFRVVPVETVLADIDQQVAAGAQHITFADPDFFNGPAHARRLIESLHAAHPGLTYDVTIKIEHLLRHRALLPLLADTGCVFVTSAAESVDDEILARLEKRHTRADFVEAVALTRAAGLALQPTFVAFTPWTTLAGYHELLDTVAELELVAHVAPVQWGLRLLITEGSRLLELSDVRDLVDRFDARTLTYPWRHRDPQVEALQQQIARHVGTRLDRPRDEVFDEVRRLAAHARGLSAVATSRRAPPLVARAAIPYLTEPWYC